MDDASQADAGNDSVGVAEETPAKLDLEVKIEAPTACERHIAVTVSRPDIERYLERSFRELVPKAEVPGFRAGRAPRKLVESRFRRDVADQVKGSLMMDALAQITEEHKLSPISEPDFNPQAIVLPDEGPMTFEFNLEVRPEFELPEWKGLKIERPTRQFTDKDVQDELRRVLSDRGHLTPVDEPAGLEDYLVARFTFREGDRVVEKFDELTVQVRPTLSFHDAVLSGFGKAVVGARAGETRTADAVVSHECVSEALRGKTLQATIEVLEVKRFELPELTPQFLDAIGFESEQELRGALKASLERRLSYEQQRRVREQVTSLLTVAAHWELPPELLRRQAAREYERAVLELRRSGFPESEIVAHRNELLQNSRQRTAQSLKEHFILERIAEAAQLQVSEQDYDDEIKLIAEQSGESVRRVRAQLEKRGLMDTLHNQIIERKTIEMILADAKFTEAPFEFDRPKVAGVDRAVGGELGESAPAAPTAAEGA